jgi:hypothetical protein
MSDKGSSSPSRNDQGLRDDSGSSHAQRSARRGIPYIVWFLFGSFSPFQRQTTPGATESGFEEEEVWHWTGIKAQLVALARDPLARELTLAAWMIGSFLFVVPFALVVVSHLVAPFLPAEMSPNASLLVLVAEVVCVALGISVVAPLVVVNWLDREGAKEDLRDVEAWLPRKEYRYEGGDGSSLDRAVVLRGDLRGRRALALATQWVAARYGVYDTDWTLASRKSLTEGERKSEEWVIRLANGEERRIYFEHSEMP